MKILHTYCLNYNIGDYALGVGLKNLLRHYLDVDMIGNTNIQGRNFDEYYINEVVNKKYDLLVIGGGGIIHGSHWPNGWFWLIEKNLIQSIKIPFIVYGVGDNYFADETVPDKAVKHLLETNRNATFFSVRNDGSHERVLDQTGIDAFEVPDPGFHVSLDCSYKRTQEEPYIIIQLADDKPIQRFGNKNDRKIFIESMRKITKKLSGQYKVIFAPHVFDDISLSKEVAKDIPNCELWEFGYMAFDHIERALQYYKYAEFVLSMRGHGQIIPISFNVPVVSLQNHPKHAGLMARLDLMEYNVDLREPNFTDKLEGVIDKVIINRIDLIRLYKDINHQLSDKTEKAFYKIKENLGDKA